MQKLNSVHKNMVVKRTKFGVLASGLTIVTVFIYSAEFSEKPMKFYIKWKFLVRILVLSKVDRPI